MADIIDLTTRLRHSAPRKPDGSLICSFEVEPGVVSLTITTLDGCLEFGVSPEGAELLAQRLMVLAIRARIECEKGGGGSHA